MALDVLIVEDERDFAEFVINGLAEVGFAVRHAAEGDEGFKLLTGHPWDLVLLDWSLPGRDGFALLRGFREAGGEVISSDLH